MSADGDAHRAAWGPLLDDLGARRAHGRAMGGEDKLARRRAPGRLDARGRVAALCDPGSFREIGVLAGDGTTPADAFVAGLGLVDGRPVYVGAEDVTVAGGSIGTAGATKRARLLALALQERAPVVLMLEGAGHRATNALSPHRPAPNDLQAMVDLAGVVPVVVLVAGPAAGHSALAAPLADHVVMVGSRGCLFAAGPPLVAAATGEQTTKEDLGGPEVHAVASGLVHQVVADDRAGTDAIRRYLSYLPSNAWQHPPGPPDEGGDVGERTLERLLDLIPPNPRRPYDMGAVLAELVDAGSLLEVGARHGASLITAYARLGGHSVAILANQPAVLGGALDVSAAEKGGRFVERATAFHLPLVQLADNPGVLAGSASERAGILRAGARLFAAQRRADVPKLHVTLRKAFGFGSSVMGQNAFDHQTVSLAFPGVTLGGIPAGVGAATSGADAETREALVTAEGSGPWRLASTVTYDDIIDPRELRNALLAGLRTLSARRAETPAPAQRTGYLP
ncbi:carboxyl transferase domain-containing protein [Nocardioides sp. YIM 152315]|uniref:acyl-CoA carboxylase subunit beta n=1 Tax=Nocardioides sp. YIM 152315 TaxID=3031760 RepID=UPI0023DAE469|nr:carboxyl transferase domain-containing protein [Nocardioides sp. YIM 152315]MDF1604680.1 carboxyl transferase domain-containing protein [Nocardioides sp. YIM 152315]